MVSCDLSRRSGWPLVEAQLLALSPTRQSVKPNDAASAKSGSRRSAPPPSKSFAFISLLTPARVSDIRSYQHGNPLNTRSSTEARNKPYQSATVHRGWKDGSSQDAANCRRFGSSVVCPRYRTGSQATAEDQGRQEKEKEEVGRRDAPVFEHRTRP